MVKEHHDLVKFLSQPAPRKRRTSSQKVQNWLANYEALLEETRKLPIEPFDAEDLGIQERDER